MAESLATTPSGAGLPRTLSGEGALAEVLTRLDNTIANEELQRVAESASRKKRN